MKILVVNAGSSSLKYQLIDMDGEKELAKGLVERIGIEGSRLKQSAGDIKTEIEMAIPDHEAAAQLMLKVLQDPESGVIKSTDEIGAVGHRVLHGGSAFTASVIVNDAAKQAGRAVLRTAVSPVRQALYRFRTSGGRLLPPDRRVCLQWTGTPSPETNTGSVP